MQVWVDAFKVFVPRRLKNSIIVNRLYSQRIPTARSLLLLFLQVKIWDWQINRHCLSWLTRLMERHTKRKKSQKTKKKKNEKDKPIVDTRYHFDNTIRYNDISQVGHSHKRIGVIIGRAMHERTFTWHPKKLVIGS